MKTISKKEKHAIYKEMVYNDWCEFGLCIALSHAIMDMLDKKTSMFADDIKEIEEVEKTFDELLLFKEDNSDNVYWLDETDRLLVLAFCIEMTK